MIFIKSNFFAGFFFFFFLAFSMSIVMSTLSSVDCLYDGLSFGVLSPWLTNLGEFYVLALCSNLPLLG